MRNLFTLAILAVGVWTDDLGEAILGTLLIIGLLVAAFGLLAIKWGRFE